MNVERVRVVPTSLPPIELSVLREYAEYRGERKVIGTTLLEVPLVGRRVQLCTLDDGEHVLLLMQDHRFCYWEATRATFEQVHQRACDWLTEPRSPNGHNPTSTAHRSPLDPL